MIYINIEQLYYFHSGCQDKIRFNAFGESNLANNPLNLALRFLLELSALYSLGYWGWTQHNGMGRILWTIGLPLLAAILWGTLRGPGHPGPAPVVVPGWVRLGVEALVFGGGVWALFAAGKQSWGLAFLAVLLVHYLLSYDYVLGLIRAGR
jgi:hypothetical protein